METTEVDKGKPGAGAVVDAWPMTSPLSPWQWWRGRRTLGSPAYTITPLLTSNCSKVFEVGFGSVVRR